MADTSTPAAYSIVSWVRRGLASLVTGQPATNYASLPVSISVNGTAVNAPAIRLLGPGDITGLDARAIIRTDPPDATDAFEPNYLAMVELAQPDLPWLFTPAGDVNGHLQPWICLIVVPDAPGATIEAQAGGLSVLRLDAPLDPKVELPDLTTIDSWAHAQVTGGGLSGSALNAAFDGDPASTLSRLIAPRKLEPNKRYLACVVPTYQAGLNAALGLPVDDGDIKAAWDGSVKAPFVLPVYYSFRFGTGPGGDFASLAQKITPPLSKLDAGTRTMDISKPGFGVAAAASKLTLGLEGALRTVGNQSTQWPVGAQTTYEGELRKSLVPPPPNSPTDSPTVAVPTYGSAQTGTPLPPAATPPPPPVWLSELNLDPRTRVAASAGTQVVQKNQEALVASSWDQLGDIRKANRLLQQAQLARQVSVSLNNRHLQTVSESGVCLQMTAPVHSRVNMNPTGPSVTLRGQIEASRLPAGAVSGAMRKLARPRGPIGRQVDNARPQMLNRLNQGTIQVAGPITPPRGMATYDGLLANSPDLKAAPPIETAGGWNKVEERPPVATRATQPIREDVPVRAAEPVKLVDWQNNKDLPPILKAGRPDLPAPIVFSTDPAQVSSMQDQFRTAAVAVRDYLSIAPATEPVLPSLGGSSGLSSTRTQLLARINPEDTIKARIGSRVTLGTGSDPLQPLRAGPEFPQPPMYTALADLSPEWMLPGISSIPVNCAALLAPNTRFIESYMVGLNEELSRELLWRQFPLGLQATYFQNFWGASNADIPPINTFAANAELGAHVIDHGSGSSLVLLIRANLFQRYPNAVVSAIPAQWSGTVRTLSDNPQDRQYPVFRGEIGSDLTFFGFEIPDPFGKPDPAAKDAGWYFVIEEHLTEPRFGLEPDPVSPPTGYWNDVSWKDVTLSGTFLNPAAASATPTLEGVTWGQSAASMAFILLRRPQRVALHALALLGPQGNA